MKAKGLGQRRRKTGFGFSTPRNQVVFVGRGYETLNIIEGQGYEVGHGDNSIGNAHLLLGPASVAVAEFVKH